MQRRLRTIRRWYTSVFNYLIRFGLFLVFLIIGYGVYDNLLRDALDGISHIWLLLIVWAFTAYLVLPRIYRRLAGLYLPNYFIGRTRTSDGLLGDPVNLAINGSEAQLIAAMTRAGWIRADELNFKSSAKITYASLSGAHYPAAPVSSLFLFGVKQNLAFEKEINGNPRKRHHVRFWKTPARWWLPGGYQADWLGAATYDKHVGLSLFTWQITHKIDADVDKERDFVVRTLQEGKAVKELEIVQHFTASYDARNGGGDLIYTDGSLPFITLSTR